jgi:hypothetical protein
MDEGVSAGWPRPVAGWIRRRGDESEKKSGRLAGFHPMDREGDDDRVAGDATACR